MSRLNKAEYIEKYGEDAWKVESKRRRSLRDKARDDAYENERKGKRNEYYKQRRLALYATKLGRADNLVRRYNNEDIKRGFDTSSNVDKEWLVNNIFTGKCVYCNDSDWRHLGADRVDDNLPHTAENIVPCCGVCNVEKGAMRMTYQDFIEYRRLFPRDKKGAIVGNAVVNGVIKKIAV